MGVPRYKRRLFFVRLHCRECSVAWTGIQSEDFCFVCDDAGEFGPLPSIYPDLD